MKKLFILSVFCFIMPMYNLSADSDLANGTIEARLKYKLAVKTGTDLNFGDVAYANTSGTVSIASDGTVGTPTNLTLPQSTRSAGSVVIFGPEGQTVNVSLPNSDLTLSTGVVISNFNSSDITPAGDNAIATGTVILGSNGEKVLHIGGTLTVDGTATNAVGPQTGNYTVSVSY